MLIVAMLLNSQVVLNQSTTKYKKIPTSKTIFMKTGMRFLTAY